MNFLDSEIFLAVFKFSGVSMSTRLIRRGSVFSRSSSVKMVTGG